MTTSEWRKIMDWLNPIEWFSWIYGKVFQQHVYLGGRGVVILFAILGLILWVRGVDKYQEDHPKTTQAASTPATSSDSGNPAPTAQQPPSVNTGDHALKSDSSV